VCLLAAAAAAATGVRVLYIDTGNGFSSHRIADLFHSLPPSQRVSWCCADMVSTGNTSKQQHGGSRLFPSLQGTAQLPDVLACIKVQKAFDAQASIDV
jgi:hypothetical protein